MNVFDLASERVIIAAHRGVCGGNIPCNTIAAYDAAVAQGADMIEIDASLSADGTLYCFHPGMEQEHLGVDLRLPELHDREIADLRYVNYDRVPTQWGLCTVDEVFARYKGRCLINVDKFWDHPEAISDLIRKHGMTDSIIVKTTPTERMLDIIESYASELAYLPIVTRREGLERLSGRRINYIGAEVIFERDDEELCAPEFISRMHSEGRLLWVNSIIYSYRTQLSGGHSDDAAIAGDEENGWGWLVDRGFDIIQTDWTLQLSLFLERTGRRYRGKRA